MLQFCPRLLLLSCFTRREGQWAIAQWALFVTGRGTKAQIAFGAVSQPSEPGIAA